MNGFLIWRNLFGLISTPCPGHSYDLDFLHTEDKEEKIVRLLTIQKIWALRRLRVIRDDLREEIDSLESARKRLKGASITLGVLSAVPGINAISAVILAGMCEAGASYGIDDLIKEAEYLEERLDRGISKYLPRLEADLREISIG